MDDYNPSEFRFGLGRLLGAWLAAGMFGAAMLATLWFLN
jgi:hypothetical protein